MLESVVYMSVVVMFGKRRKAIGVVTVEVQKYVDISEKPLAASQLCLLP